ncbi:hypothetical protein, partial [Colwellia sp. BRX8-6]
MNKDKFVTNPEVIDFVAWAVNLLPSLEVNLNISRKGTGRAIGTNGPGVQGMFVGVDAITSAYQWLGRWKDADGNYTESCDWHSTKNSLNELSQWLRNNIQAGSSIEVIECCKQILIWGGDRNPAVGAGRFLGTLKDEIRNYLIDARSQLSLEVADLRELDGICEMNSMLTKVHALAADDGLPIYDSRVAGAFACLVEIYRQNMNTPWNQIPELLVFKAVDYADRRRVLGMNNLRSPVVDPGVITRATNPAAIETRSCDWASSKIRLGWIMEEIISVSEKKELF